MKELQNIIHRHFEDPKQKKRYLAVLIALSMLVSFMVPLILMEPADSITKSKFRASSAPVINRPENLGEEISGTMLNNYAGENANEFEGYTYSPEQMDLFTLLFGAGVNSEGELIPLKWYTDDNGNVLSLDAALEAAASEYFLGFANDFCAFIEGDFTATDADAEGRVLVGGDLKFDSNTNKWNYQVGSGDFGNFLPMNQTEEYNGMFGYASAIVGGKLFRIGTLSTGHTDWIDKNPNQYDRHINDKTPFYHPEEGLYKSFVVGDIENSLHYHYDSNSDIPYTDDFNLCNHDYPGNCPSCAHTYLEDTNEQAQLYAYNNVSEILEKTFNTLRTRSASLGQIKAINVTPKDGTLTLDASNIGDADTVYFNLVLENKDEDPYGDWDGNISNINIIVPDDRVTLGTNIYSEGNETVTNLDLNIVVNCGEEQINISNSETHTWIFKSSDRKNGYKISNLGNGDKGPKKNTNNHPVSSNILYNFPNAQNVTLSGNFNGTILAPNADVTSPEACPGHLSGALIAKSFEGGLEFGYRPYRGGNDILGMASGYEVPVEKLIAGTDMNLAGAMFAIKEGDNVISLFESINGVNHVAIPSDVDFTGNTVYMPESIETGSATKDTTSNVPVNTNLVKPLIVTAYDSSGNEITWDSESDLGDFNIGTTIVLRANQPVEWIQKVYNDTVNFTTNDDNSLTLKINKPIENNAAYNFNVKIKGINSSEKTLHLNVNPVTITATPSSYTIGEKVALNISGVSDDIVVKYKYDNANSYIELDEESSFITDRIGENIKIIAELYHQENENLTKLHETSTIIKGYLPEGMVLAVTPDQKYVVGNDQVSMNVVNAPIGATIKYYFNDNNNAVYTVKKENADTNISYTFNPMVIGESIPLKAEVFIKNSSGNEEKVSPPFETTIKGELPTMDLIVEPMSYTIGDSILLNVTNVPTGATVKFYLYESYNWQLKQGDASTTCELTPTQVGDNVQVKAEVYLPGKSEIVWDKITTIKGKHPDMSITATADELVVGNQITLSVLGAPSDSVINYLVQGTNHYSTESTFTPNTAGTYTIKATVKYRYNNVELTNEITKTITVNEATLNDNNETTEQTTLSTFSIRKGVNRLSTESEQESIEITAPDGKTIKSIKLNTDLIDNNNYSLDVKFYDANNVQKGDTVTVNNSNVNNAINCPDGEAITKIVVEAALGAVKVKSYDVTYTEPCKSVTKTGPFDLQTNSENSYVIDADVFNKLVASDSSDNKLTDYDSITFTLSSNAAAPNVEYWLYKDAQEVEHSDKKSFENGSFTINDLSSRGITKIVIKAKDNTALPIVSYSIVSLTATDTEPKPVNNMKEIEHTYVIEEIEAPHGFFPTTDKYEVKVVETFDLENISVVNGKYYPNSVDTVITVNKITKNSDGTENKTSVYETKLRIKYGEKDNSIDTNTRIIEVMNDNAVSDTFTIVKSSDALTGVNQIESVSHNNTPLDIDLTKADLIEGGKYYFNPDTMMIVPMPEDNIEFENTPGLLFKKVDDRGYAVKDVEITLTPSTNGNGESLWSWVEGTTSEQLINVSQLTPGNVYRISEFDDRDDIYITAPDIFFKYEGGKIYYGASESDLTNELDLINNREIRMVDMRIVGVELEINKVDESGKPLKGAVFDLYADVGEGVPLKSGIEVDDENGKTTVNLADVDNSTYVENGYLKPGNYYLIETQIPTHTESDKWYENPGKIKFRVKDDFTVEYINEQTGGNTGGSENTGNGLSAVNRNDQKKIADVFMSDGSALNISNVTGVEIVVESWNASPTIQIYIADLEIKSGFEKSPGSMNNSSYFKYNDTNLNISTLKKVEIQNWTDDNVVVRYVKITTSDNGDYIFCDPSYTPTSAASLEDETAVVDETGEGTESESGEGTETESGESTEGETGENTGEETPAVERELLEVSDGENGVKVLTVTNKEDDNERDVNVEKRWAGDTGFDELRPDVTFTLYQSKTEISDISQLTPEMIYKITNGEGNEVPYTITITEPDANGKWTGKFTGLPTKYLSNGEYVDYHYYIVETTVDGYLIEGYSKDVDGTLVAENKLDPVSVKATKKWSDPTGIGTKPESITVQLQVKVDGTWTNVEGKTLTLTATDNWTGNFTGLVKGKEYRLTESYVNGWEVESNPGSVVNGDPTENLTITNKPKEVEKGSLSISKLWQNAQGGELTTPNVSEVYVQLYRKVNKLWPVGQPLLRSQGANSVQDDYARLLQYSLYFYDGLMCGDQVDENSAYSWRDECHTYESVTVPGGYHDAGDHVMFGLPAGFSASSLGWSLYEFRDEYDELGQTAHTKVITDYYADFFSRCIRDNNGTKEILVQKGHGNTDHKYWGIPEGQPEEKWGQAEYWVSGTGADIAAEYAAALALSCLNFYETDPNKYRAYLEKAKELYAYAEANQNCFNEVGVNKDETNPDGGFYISNDYKDDMAWASAWISLASTKANDAESANTYKSKSQSILRDAEANNNMYDWGSYNWNNVKQGAYLVNAAYLDGNWQTVRDFVTGYYNNNTYNNLIEWGAARYNTGYQTIALVAAKHQQEGANVGIDVNTAKGWAQGQMDFILGGNAPGGQEGICLITNFTDNSVKRPHFRAGSGQVFDMAEKDDETIIDSYDDKNRLIGGLVGGPTGYVESYEDRRSDYKLNEVASDYNANLVGAAAGLYYFYRTGELYEIPGVKVQYLPDEEPETQAEETPAPQEEETPAPQAEEQQQSDDNSSNTVDTQTESSNTTASETVSSEQNSSETNTETGENSAQVAKLSSRFSNAFSILSVGFSRLATEGTNGNVKSINLTSDQITAITGNGGWSISQDNELYGKNITRIEIALSSQTGNLKLNNCQLFNGTQAIASGVSWNKDSMSWVIVSEQNVFKTIYNDGGGSVSSNAITNILFSTWGATVNSITICYEVPGISITNTDTNITEGDTLNLTYSGAAEGKTVTWSLPEGTSAAEIINGNVLKANNVDSDTDVEVTVSDTETTDTKTFTVKPLAFVDTKTTMNLKENSPQTLKLNSTRNLLENFKFESSDNSIVKVENGIATAVGEGTATITATDINNPAISATVNIEVKDVKPLTLGISANDIVINGTATLEPSEEAVTYKNYDGNIIQINGNTITAKKNGSTKITAETSDGRTAEVTINVLEMSINVEKNSIEVTEEVILTINNPPHNATFEWQSNNSQIVSVNNGTIKGVSAGSTQVYVIAKVNGNEVARATTENITVNYGRIMGEVNVSNQYKPVHTQNGESKSFDSYNVFTKDNTPNLLKNQTIDYIAVQFSYNNNTVDNKNVSGVFMYSLATSDDYINVNFSLNEQQNCTQLQNGVLYIPIDPGVEIDAVKFNKWNNDREAKVENIYFYSKKQTPSISGVPTESDPFIVGDEPITLTANHFDGKVEWSIVSGSEYATIDPNTGLLTIKDDISITSDVTVKVKATYAAASQEATADVIIKPYQLAYQTGETDTKNFKVHVGPTPNDVMIDLPSDTGFTINDNVTDIAKIEGNKITGLKTGSVGFTAEYNGDSINGTIEVIDPLAITAEGNKDLILSNQTLQFTASNFVGTVQWTVSGDGIATISGNGLLKPTSAGNVTVTATDTDGTTATYDVTIQLGSALVDITGMEPVGEIITISSESEWVATVDNLPVVDPNGDYYSYYIVECDKNGNVIENSNPIRGTDGSTYIPISYENGEMLNTGSLTELSVSNRYSGKTQGQMPSSGGVGRTTYYFFGGMIMLLSAAGYTCTRRRQSSRRAK